MMRLILGALALLVLSALPAKADGTANIIVVQNCGTQALQPWTATAPTLGVVTVDTTGKVCGSAAGSYFYNVAGSTLTRASDTTAYSANQTVCLSKSQTCVPGTIAIANINKGQATINRLSFLKSGSSTTSATFTVWMFSAAPVLTSPTQQDATAYTGPRAADMPNYIGNAACSTATATSDTSAQVWYECVLSNPNTAGALVAQAVNGTVNIQYLISATAAYTPANAETFTPFVSGFY